jgi:hypothetical protein
LILLRHSSRVIPEEKAEAPKIEYLSVMSIQGD